LKKLDALRLQLLEQAFVLDQRGRIDASDAAMTASPLIAELGAELSLREPFEA
jgi:hypothetical protein